MLEVLISMFVLLFGLMGVASIFPVGNYYAGRGDQYDRGAALADAGFAELKARGLLRPDRWLYGGAPYQAAAMQAPFALMANGAFQVPIPPSDPDEPHPGHVFIIDPISTAPVWGNNNADVFPLARFGNTASDRQPNITMGPAWKAVMQQCGVVPGGNWPIRRMTLPVPNPSTAAAAPPAIGMPLRVARSLFALHDDLAIDTPEEDDRPGIQRWRTDNNGTENPLDDVPLARQSAGSYTWFATVSPTTPQGVGALQPIHPMYGSELYEVSVAVVHRRAQGGDDDGERALKAALRIGGELILYHDQGNLDSNVAVVDAALEGVRAGQWIALAGCHPTSGRLMLRWYRLLSLEDETDDQSSTATKFNTSATAIRRAMIEGADWPAGAGAATGQVGDLSAILVPGVIGVSTQYLPMEEGQ